MGEIFVLALGSALWPLLIAVTIVALRSPNPPKLLSFFLAGSLLATISIGVVIVLALDDTALVNRSRSTYDPVVYFTAGALMLVVGAWCSTRLPERPKARIAAVRAGQGLVGGAGDDPRRRRSPSCSGSC